LCACGSVDRRAAPAPIAERLRQAMADREAASVALASAELQGA
jgi:hypothetical protein